MTAFGEAVPQDEPFDGRVGVAMRRGVAPRHRSEADVVRDALGLLRSLGYARKVHGGAHGNVGEPDIDGCVSGRALKLEAKSIGNKPTGAQYASMRRWASAGALVGWFRTNGELCAILDHVADIGFVPDLDRPGCSCARHVQVEP